LAVGLRPILAVLALLVSSLPAQQETGDELIELVVKLLADEDKDLRALALEQVRSEAKGERATEQFAAQLPKLPTETQVALLRALADRGDRAARGAVLDRMDHGDEAARVAAIDAVALLGEPADGARLLKFLAEGSTAERAAARKSLERLPGAEVSQAVAGAMAAAEPSRRVVLIEILATRRAFDTTAPLRDAAVDGDAAVRAAAMEALGQLAGPDDIPAMVQGVLKASRGAERAAAEKAVMFACARSEPPDERAAPLLAAINTLSVNDRLTMLSTLGRVGGPAALAVVEKAIGSSDAKQHSAGIGAISNWPDASIAPRLIELAQQDEHEGHRITVLRALIRVAPLPDERSDLQRLELLQQAMSMCHRDAERNLVIQRAQAIRIAEALRYVVPYLDRPAYAQQACETIVELAHHRNLREPNKAEFHQALDKVIQISKDKTVVDRANRYKNNQTWVRPRPAAR
jgi:HEAT repeat protein